MTFNQLKYVVAVAKTGSINKAAADLFISQSVVSTAIAGLEKEIGHDIFVRSNRGVALTPFRHTFVSYVSSIQAQLVQLDSLIRRDFVQHEFRFPSPAPVTISSAASVQSCLSVIAASVFESSSSRTTKTMLQTSSTVRRRRSGSCAYGAAIRMPT